MTLLAAMVLDYGRDVPDAYLERQRALLVHAAQLARERDHVRRRAAGQAHRHRDEFPAAGLREAGIVPAWIR
jgi:hypothetical protein